MPKKLIIALIVLSLVAMACSLLSFNLPSPGDIVGTALATSGFSDVMELATMLTTSGFGDEAQGLVETMMAGGGGDAQGMVETMMAGGTAVPMETLMAGFQPLGNLQFQDDFSDTSSGWDRSSFENGATDYQDGGYHIFVAPENYSVWANPGLYFTDISVEVDGYKLSGADDNEYGLICRYVDNNNFYVASISSEGYYGITRLLNGEFQYIGSESMQPSSAINQGGANNHIRFDCVGTTLTLYVNGVEVASFEDDTHASGDVGLYAGTFNSPNIDIFFDNFIASQP